MDPSNSTNATGDNRMLNQETRHKQGSNPRPSLNQDELRALKECNRESFWYRCVPAGIVLVGTSQLLVNKGYLHPHPRFGSLFKNMGAALLAYFLGKISYQDACRQKIMRLENSSLAEAMRKGKRGSAVFSEIASPAVVTPDTRTEIPSYTPNKRLQEEYSQRDFDSDSNVQSRGLDSTFQPSLDSTGSSLPVQPKTSDHGNNTSYEELRRRNRTDHEKSLFMSRAPTAAPQQEQPESLPQFTPLASSDTYSSTRSTDELRHSHQAEEKPTSKSAGRRVRRNQYGDIIED